MVVPDKPSRGTSTPVTPSSWNQTTSPSPSSIPAPSGPPDRHHTHQVCNLDKATEWSPHPNIARVSLLPDWLQETVDSPAEGPVAQSGPNPDTTGNKGMAKESRTDTHVQDCIAKLTAKNDFLLCKVSTLQAENQLLKTKLSFFECEALLPNLRFHGLPEHQNENPEAVVYEFLKDTGFEINARAMERAYRTGPPPGSIQTRPILVRFNNFEDRNIIWQRLGHKFLPPEFNSKHVREDFPTAIENDRQKLIPIARAALNYKDPTTNKTPFVKLNKDKLFINNQVYTVETLGNLPDYLKLESMYLFKPKMLNKATSLNERSSQQTTPKIETMDTEHIRWRNDVERDMAKMKRLSDASVSAEQAGTKSNMSKKDDLLSFGSDDKLPAAATLNIIKKGNDTRKEKYPVSAATQNVFAEQKWLRAEAAASQQASIDNSATKLQQLFDQKSIHSKKNDQQTSSNHDLKLPSPSGLSNRFSKKSFLKKDDQPISSSADLKLPASSGLSQNPFAKKETKKHEQQGSFDQLKLPGIVTKQARKKSSLNLSKQRNVSPSLSTNSSKKSTDCGTSKSQRGLVISGNASGSNTNTSTVSSCNTHQVTKRPAPVRKFTPAKASAVAAASKGNILSEGQSNRDHGLVNGEPMAYEDLGMFSNPEAALAAALHSIAKEDWLDKCNGLNGIRRLAKHHPETLTNDLPAVALAVMTEAKNLRSSVCRMGAICIGDMCCALKKRMDPSVEKISKLMLTQAGAGASKFLIESAEDALYKMTEYCSPPKVVTGLMFGVGSKNVLVRKSTSTMMAFLVEILTSSRVLTGQKDLTDKVLTSAATFIKDSAPESRYNGQKIFTLLMDDPKFEQQYAKNVPESTRNDIKEKLNNLRRKGLPEPPGEHSSARGRRMEGLASSNVRGHSAHSDQPAHKAGKGPGPRSNATMHDVHEEIQAFTQQMAANDFRERIKAISRFTDQLQKHPGAICNHLTKIFDNFIPCLRDVNSKTALHALCALHEVLPAVATSMGASISLTVDTVASNLASKNKEISSMAVQVLDAFLNNVEAVQLLQPFVSVAKGGNDRAKPDMVERISFLSTQVYEEKPKLVKVHVLPLLWSLLGGQSAAVIAAGHSGGSPSARDATSHLTLTLYRLMGQELFQAANSTTGVNPRMIQTLRDMVQAT